MVILVRILQTRSRGKSPKVHHTTSDPPSKTPEIWNNPKEPQKRRGYLNRLYIMETADNPEKENIQGVGLHTFQESQGGNTAAPEGG